jgi:hypothetical protein
MRKVEPDNLRFRQFSSPADTVLVAAHGVRLRRQEPFPGATGFVGQAYLGTDALLRHCEECGKCAVQ